MELVVVLVNSFGSRWVLLLWLKFGLNCWRRRSWLCLQYYVVLLLRSIGLESGWCHFFQTFDAHFDCIFQLMSLPRQTASSIHRAWGASLWSGGFGWIRSIHFWVLHKNFQNCQVVFVLQCMLLCHLCSSFFIPFDPSEESFSWVWVFRFLTAKQRSTRIQMKQKATSPEPKG